jgi:AAA15 family ATPase/GTPase
MLKRLTVENDKSVHNVTLELSRINIFIGENGCGKTNILEALAMASASKALEGAFPFSRLSKYSELRGLTN